MSKKKKKKKPDREKTPETHKGEAGLALLEIILVLSLFLYDFSFKFFTLKIYEPFYFASTKAFNVRFMYLILFAVVNCIIAIFVFPNPKKQKKHLFQATTVLFVTLAIIIILSGNVWVVNENSISYNTLFQKNKIVYSYDDIENAEMSISYEHISVGHTYNIDYILYMNDGEKVKFNAYESFRENDDKLIEFDKAISNKRKADGEFIYIDQSSEEFNKYYQSLFTNTE